MMAVIECAGVTTVLAVTVWSLSVISPQYHEASPS